MLLTKTTYRASFYSSSLNKLFKHSLALALATGALASCRPNDPQPATNSSSNNPTPAPTPLPTPAPASTPTASLQYGTPFARVPNREDAVIYQLNTQSFSQGGNFAGITARLDSIKAIGVNVLYLMPIYPIGALKSIGSPYCVKDYTEVNPNFGTLNDLRTLVDGAHARGMSVMLDWVPNHTSFDHVWTAPHPDWYLRDAAGNILAPPNTGFNDVAQLDFANGDMRLAMIAAMKSWVYKANVDGFRCDFSDNQPTDFWVQAIDTLRNIKTHKLLMLAEGVRGANYTSGFDYNFGFNWYGALRKIYSNAVPATSLDVYNTYEYAGTATTQQVVRYTTCQDMSNTEGSPVALYGGNAGAMSAFVIASCYKGVPFIYNGQEVGMTTSLLSPFSKIQWGLHSDVKRAYQQLLTARAASPALQHGTPTSYSTANVCAFTKTAGSSQALVLVNVRNSPTSYPVPAALANSTWTNALLGGTYSVGTQVTLPAYGYLILKK